jgi:hypothetical protein
MNAAIGSAIKQSSVDFANHVWPHVNPLMGGGTFLPVEGSVSSQLADDLDRIAGIDILHYPEAGGMRGIASRVQYNRPEWRDRYPWDTFTVRKSRRSNMATEYHKRVSAIDSGGRELFPYLTVQAYLEAPNDGPLVSAAVARTADLFYYLQQNTARTQKVAGGSEMYVIRWRELEQAGFPVKVVRP